jgi:restriction system protein
MGKRRKDYLIDVLAELISGALVLLLIGGFLWAIQNKEKMKFYGFVALGVTIALVVVAIIIFILIRRRNKKIERNYFDDNEILAMFKGLKPEQFEEKVADIFSGLGYETELTGGPHDGGIDIVAMKDGEKFYIQCKKYITSQAGVHEVRDFYGAVTGDLAKKGFFVTANKFTLDAEKFAEGNARLELIDGLELVRYYKLAKGGKIEEAPALVEKCPQCGGNLVLRANHKTGEKFYGCSNYPKCRFMKSLK